MSVFSGGHSIPIRESVFRAAATFNALLMRLSFPFKVSAMDVEPYPLTNSFPEFGQVLHRGPHFNRSTVWKMFVVLGILFYITLVHLLRYRRRERIQARYTPDGRASFSKLTNNQAQAIIKDLTELEFPKFFGFSIIFALFKVGFHLVNGGGPSEGTY